MAKSADLKNAIIVQLKKEWENPALGADWKDGVTDEVLVKLYNRKNWKRVYKGRGLFGKGTPEDFVMRQFLFGGEESDIVISATVTCDKNDAGVLDIEIEQQ